MLVIFNKNDGYVVGTFSNDQQIEKIYNNNVSILARLDGVYVDDDLIPRGNIRDYKVVNGVLVKKTVEETPVNQPGPTQQAIADLKDTNQMLGQQVVDLDLRLLMGGM